LVITTELPQELRETTDVHLLLLIETLLAMLVELPIEDVAMPEELPEVAITEEMPMEPGQLQQHRHVGQTTIIYSEEILCVEQEEEQHQHKQEHGLETTHQLPLEQELEESEEIIKIFILYK
jgi:hypothetical protein